MLAGTYSLAGDWLAKAEYGFPNLDAHTISAAPHLPSAPPLLQKVPGYLFNGMIHPLLPYAIRGVIWYQGEENTIRAYQYRTAFPLMISDWRKQWDHSDLPFYFCQLANFKDKLAEPGESNWAELREAQSLALKLPNTGEAVLIDIGEAEDIHPRNKRVAGERVAVIALARDYGKSNIYSAPMYQSMKIKDGKAFLHFTNTGSRLVAKALPNTYDVRSMLDKTSPLVRNRPNSQLEGFAICGKDQKWVWADAKIEGDTVVVWSEKVPEPVAVRYAWADNPTCNLSCEAGLPVSPFKTDDFMSVTSDPKN
jgi:sialate O-acetylesterase